MSETSSALKQFASSPMGITILIVVGLIVVVGGGVPLWRSLKYMFKGFLWALLVILVVALAAGALWVWLEYKTPNTEKRAKMRQEAVDVLRGRGGKPKDGAASPAPSNEAAGQKPALGENGNGG